MNGKRRGGGGSDRCASTQVSVDTDLRLKVGIKRDERMNDGGGGSRQSGQTGGCDRIWEL